jgi:hypothetical protein
VSDEKFNPAAFMRQLKARGGGTSDYLDVKWRLVWLRSEHPEARIETELREGGVESNYAVFKASVSIPDGGSATGWGSETKADFGDFLEKAETKALGRALIALGYGAADATADEALDSAPIAPRPRPAPARNAAPALAQARAAPAPAPAARQDEAGRARAHALKRFGPVPATLPEVEAQLAPLAKQVRTNDESLSPGEYQRYHDLEAKRKELLTAAPPDDLAIMRSMAARPEARKAALHRYYALAESPADLNVRADVAYETGIDADVLKAAFRHHHDRLSKKLAPAGING